jgi:hypothetical protein
MEASFAAAIAAQAWSPANPVKDTDWWWYPGHKVVAASRVIGGDTDTRKQCFLKDTEIPARAADCPTYKWCGGEQVLKDDGCCTYPDNWWLGGSTHTFTFNVPDGCAGAMKLQVTYARGSDGSGNQWATIGGIEHTLSYPSTTNWDSATGSTTIEHPDSWTVTVGENTLSVRCDEGQNTGLYELVPV